LELLKQRVVNALHIVVLYHRLRENPKLDVPPRGFGPHSNMARPIVRCDH
jgi:hypothetical protein